MSASEPRIAVLIASKGRSRILESTIPFINNQTLKPVSLILSVSEAGDADFDLDALLDPDIHGKVIIGSSGCCKQRNRAMALLDDDIDYFVFYDDDFYPSRHSLAELARAFEHHGDVDGITGKLVADGINSSGIQPDKAALMIQDWDSAHCAESNGPPVILRESLGLYGCNMAFRRKAAMGLQFDERLPAYSWQEDVDFAERLPGRRVVIESFTGVHLGTKIGREKRGELLGYSQIVNPYYLWRKGTIPKSHAVQLVLGNIAANHVKSLKPEPWVDRAGRMRGNWIGLRDVVTGRADPSKIETW